jgi:hypothetical protein
MVWTLPAAESRSGAAAKDDNHGLICDRGRLGAYPVLKPLIGDAVDTAALVRGWAELIRLRASIEAGAVAPSTILRKLAATGPNNTLSQALRALGTNLPPSMSLMNAGLISLARILGRALRRRPIRDQEEARRISSASDHRLLL